MVLPDSKSTDRRHFLRFSIVAMAGVAARQPAIAQTFNNASPSAPIERLDSALLATMKAASSMSFEARYATLEPIIAQVFNLDAVLAASVGLSWATMQTAQKVTLAQAFRHYTVSSYVSNFNSYNGQNFETLPPARTLANGEVVVQTRLMRPNDSPLRLDYVMRDGTGWQAVDVLTDGSISRVAVQRSDFRQLLASGGVPGLTAGLERKVANLSGGMAG
jgi:phospholipid transport system substrate-binding protein